MAYAEPGGFDGWSVRGELGFGYYSATKTNREGTQTFHEQDRGAGPFGGLYLGKAGSSSYIRGVAFTISSAVHDWHGWGADDVNLVVIGPYYLLYPIADYGLNVGVVPGLAFVYETYHGNRDGVEPGLGLSMSLGYDWQVGESWALGVVGRLSYAGVIDFRSWSSEVLSPGLLFTATCCLSGLRR